MAREVARDEAPANGANGSFLIRDAPQAWKIGLYLLDKYGIPLLMLALTIAALVVMYRQNRDDSQARQAQLSQALDRNTKAIEELNATQNATGKLIERLSDRLDEHLRATGR
jgi:hypothetical protein